MNSLSAELPKETPEPNNGKPLEKNK